MKSYFFEDKNPITVWVDKHPMTIGFVIAFLLTSSMWVF